MDKPFRKCEVCGASYVRRHTSKLCHEIRILRRLIALTTRIDVHNRGRIFPLAEDRFIVSYHDQYGWHYLKGEFPSVLEAEAALYEQTHKR